MSFVVRVSDGRTKVSTPVTVEVAPTQISDVDEVSTGVNPGATWVAVTLTLAFVA